MPEIHWVAHALGVALDVAQKPCPLHPWCPISAIQRNLAASVLFDVAPDLLQADKTTLVQAAALLEANKTHRFCLACRRNVMRCRPSSSTTLPASSVLHIKNRMRYLVFWSSVLQHSKHEECHRGALRNFSMTLLNAGTVKTSSLHGTNAAPDGALPTDPWEAMASRAGLSPQGGEVP